MNPPQMFISHRTEYAEVARDLKKHIQATSQDRIKVFVSDDIRDIPGGLDWRLLIEKHLREAESLILIYGAPYEDWSWCFYETGYFAALDRRIYCITRPDVDPPAPLNHLQMVTSTDKLIEELMGIYGRHGITTDASKLRPLVETLEDRLFGEIREFNGYPRIQFKARNRDFGADGQMPADARFEGNEAALGDLFGFNSKSVQWAEIEALAKEPSAKQNFMTKWVEETTRIILAARKNKFISPQTVLIGREDRRFRTILHRARSQADQIYCCEFLAIAEVGGPAVGLSSQHLSLLTSIRMGFRFRSEVIKKLRDKLELLPEEDRRTRILQIPRLIDNLEIESKARGDIDMDSLVDFFGDEGERIQTLVGYWPILKLEMYRSLGLSDDGKSLSRAPDFERFHKVSKALDSMNKEFLARCCAHVPKMMMKNEGELSDSAKQIDQAVRALTKPRPDPLPERQRQNGEPGRSELPRGRIPPAERAVTPSDHVAI